MDGQVFVCPFSFLSLSNGVYINHYETQIPWPILRRQGNRALEATEGGEALVMCEKEKNPIDLILTDVVMPHMSGPELIEWIRKVRADFKVLYMTGYTDEAIVQHGGVVDKTINLIHKPFTIEQLARKVREVLDKS